MATFVRNRWQLSPEYAETLFQIWASSQDSDAERKLDFYSAQQLAYWSKLSSGEVYTTLPIIPGRKGAVTSFCVQLIEADRVCNPPTRQENKTLRSGIELDKYGAPSHYWINSAYPMFKATSADWHRVAAYGPSGRRNVIHYFDMDRPGQNHGIPYLAPIVEELKQLGRYQESELQAAVVSSLFTVFVKSDTGDTMPFFPKDDETTDSESFTDYSMGPGQVVGLKPGEDISTAEPGRPSSKFNDFFQAVCEKIGVAIGLPYELLLKHFSSSFTAARGAILEAWKDFLTMRKGFVRRWCQPIYEEWLAYQIASGVIEAPGFFDSPIIRKAWSNAVWLGPSPGLLNPFQEAKAQEVLLKNHLTSHSQATARLTGEDWDESFDRLVRENIRLKELLGVSQEEDNGT